MFLGTYAPKLDDKGRIILPAKFREELASKACAWFHQQYFVLAGESCSSGKIARFWI